MYPSIHLLYIEVWPGLFDLFRKFPVCTGLLLFLIILHLSGVKNLQTPIMAIQKELRLLPFLYCFVMALFMLFILPKIEPKKRKDALGRLSLQAFWPYPLLPKHSLRKSIPRNNELPPRKLDSSQKHCGAFYYQNAFTPCFFFISPSPASFIFTIKDVRTKKLLHLSKIHIISTLS